MSPLLRRIRLRDGQFVRWSVTRFSHPLGLHRTRSVFRRSLEIDPVTRPLRYAVSHFLHGQRYRSSADQCRYLGLATPVADALPFTGTTAVLLVRYPRAWNSDCGPVFAIRPTPRVLYVAVGSDHHRLVRRRIARHHASRSCLRILFAPSHRTEGWLSFAFSCLAGGSV